MNYKYLFFLYFLCLFQFSNVSANKFKIEAKIETNGEYKQFIIYKNKIYPISAYIISPDKLNISSTEFHKTFEFDIHINPYYVVYLNNDTCIVEYVDPDSWGAFYNGRGDKTILGFWDGYKFVNPEEINGSSSETTSDSTSSGGQGNGSVSGGKLGGGSGTGLDGGQDNGGDSSDKSGSGSGKGSSNGSSKSGFVKSQEDKKRVMAIANVVDSRPLSSQDMLQKTTIITKVETKTKNKIIDTKKLTQKAFATKDPKDILAAIESNNNAINYVESSENKLAQLDSGIYIKTRNAKRKAISEYTTHDGKIFKNKKISFGKQIKKGIYKLFAKKKKLKKEKYQKQFAVADGLKHENELLHELYEEQIKKIKEQDNNQDIIGINPDDFNNLFLENASTDLDKNGDVQSEVLQENQVDEILETANENQEEINSQIDDKPNIDNGIIVDNNIPDNYTNSTISPYISDNLPKNSGFIKSTTRDLLKFGKSCAIKNPELTRAAVTVINGAIQGILNDETLIPKIKDTIKETKKSLKAKDLVSDFDRDNFNSAIDKPSKQNLNKKAKTKFKKLVEQKITDKKIELGDFYEECTNLSVSKKDNPVIYFSNKYSLQACETVKQGLDIADDYFIENELELANTFTDTSSSLLKAAKGTAKFFKLLGQGSIEFMLNNPRDPIQSIIDLGRGSVDLARSLGRMALKFAKLRALAVTEPKLAAEKIQAFCDNLSNKFNEIKNDFANLSYENKVVLISQELTEFFSDGAVSVGLLKNGLKAVSFFEKLPKLAKKEQAVAKLAKKILKKKASYLKKIVTPLSNAVMETSEIIEIAGMHGQRITRASLNVVAKNKNILRSEKTIAGAVKNVIKRTEKSQQEFVNLVDESKSLHITIGDSTGGGHMFPGRPKKSIFPKSWSKEKILHEASDIATDPNLQWIPQDIRGKHARFKVEGVRDDLLIRVIVEPNGKGIITAFPLKGNGVFCNLKN